MTEILDTRGLICPLPVLKARKKLMTLPKGTLLKVIADDPRAPDEFRLYCEETGVSLVETTQKDHVAEILIVQNDLN